MRIGLTANGKYNIIDGNDVLCQCADLTSASAVLLYLSLRPVTVLEKSIARLAIHNWDMAVKAEEERKQAVKQAKKARQKARKQALKQTPSPETESPEQVKETDQSETMTEGAENNDGHREKEEIRKEEESGENV